MDDAIQKAAAAIEAAHDGDPRRHEGRPYERFYSERLLVWVQALNPQPPPELLLAARAQHLERWAIPREDYPAGRGGYLKWRSDVHRRQGARAGDILREAGCDPALVTRVAELVGKSAPKGDAFAQTLEDAACLVFLESELESFLALHPRDKTIDVLRKTWRKMSPAGQHAAASLSLTAAAAAVVREAVGG
jgi:hypothetical protein